MNLREMSIDDLKAFRDGLKHVEASADLLTPLGEVTITLTDRDTTLRCGPVLQRSLCCAGDCTGACADGLFEEGEDSAAGPVLIEDPEPAPAPEPEPDPEPVATAAGVAPLPDSPATPSAPAVSKNTTTENDTAPASRPRIRCEDGLWRGEWRPEEDDTLVEMRAAGHSWAKIAAALERTKAATVKHAKTCLADRVTFHSRPRNLTRAVPVEDAPVQASAPAVITKSPDPEIPTGGAEPTRQSDAPAGPVGTLPASRRTDAGSAPAVSSGGAAPALPRADADLGELQGEARLLWVHVEGLKSDPLFDADLDFDLCDGLFQGRKLAEMALDLDLDAKVARDRFSLLSAAIRDGRGQCRIDGQKALMEVLKRRVALARGVAA